MHFGISKDMAAEILQLLHHLVSNTLFKITRLDVVIKVYNLLMQPGNRYVNGGN